MIVRPIKTPIVNIGDNLGEIIIESLPTLEERSVIVVTSKVVALSERRVFAKKTGSKDERNDLVRQEADRYVEPDQSKYGVMLTIKDQILAVNAGIDESNVADHYVGLPANSYRSASKIWQLLRDHFGLRELGVVISDSSSLPLKWGTVGRALSYCGLQPLKDLIGQPDLHGRPLAMTKMNLVEGIAAAAVLEMGEGSEQTPLAVVSELSHLEFSDRPPSQEEIAELLIELEDDVYYPLLKGMKNDQ